MNSSYCLTPATAGTVAIVDDEPENLNLLDATLSHAGYRVLLFPRGELAIAAAHEAPPDLMLLDIRMPGMDGYEVCRHFKADESLRFIPVIFVSALSATDDIAAGFACGGVDYITKPYREAEVLARVRTHIALRRAHAALAAQHARLTMAVRAGGVGLWEYDVARNRLVWDEQMLRLHGIPRAQFSGAYEAWQARVHPDDRQRSDQEIRLALRGEKTFDSEFRVLWPDGTVHCIRGFASVQRDAAGHPVRMLGTNWDITERKRAEEELQRRSRQLAQLTSDLTVSEHRERRRLADLLHDHLQQLLFGAQMQASSLATGSGTDNGEVVEALQRTLENALESSRSITKDLAPPLSLHKDVPAAIAWLAREEMRGQDPLTVSVRIDTIEPALPEAIAVLLFTAARELLRNVARHGATHEASLRLTQESGNVVLVVRDPGKGAAPEALQPPDERRGFGLFSIRERAELLGGSLRVDTAPGRGMCVTLSLPVQAPAPAPVDAADTPAPGSRRRPAKGTPPAPAPPRGRGLRVVFADDHRVVREALINLLGSQRAFSIVGEAGNGEEAVAAVERLHPDVVVMDVSMPVMDGVQATRIITQRWPEVKVIGLSMFDDETVAGRMRKAGATAYVTKSAPMETLIAAICACGTGGRSHGRPGSGGRAGTRVPRP